MIFTFLIFLSLESVLFVTVVSVGFMIVSFGTIIESVGTTTVSIGVTTGRVVKLVTILNRLTDESDDCAVNVYCVPVVKISTVLLATKSIRYNF